MGRLVTGIINISNTANIISVIASEDLHYLCYFLSSFKEMSNARKKKLLVTFCIEICRPELQIYVRSKN